MTIQKYIFMKYIELDLLKVRSGIIEPLPEFRYSPDQPRDDHGRFTTVGGSGDLGLTENENSGTMNTGSDGMENETQRYGRNKNTLVDKSYIESGEYRRKFDTITDDSDTNRMLYNCAKKSLLHRSGTEYEDMYWIDSTNGEIIASEIDSKLVKEITYSKNTTQTIENYPRGRIITIHSHPSSMPPSIEDFNSNYLNGYELGVVACHNGKIFVYRSGQEVSSTLYSMYLANYKSDGCNDYTAQLNTLMKIRENHLIEFWEVQ